MDETEDIKEVDIEKLFLIVDENIELIIGFLYKVDNVDVFNIFWIEDVSYTFDKVVFVNIIFVVIIFCVVGNIDKLFDLYILFENSNVVGIVDNRKDSFNGVVDVIIVDK